ncbi:MAG: transposase domain-containing protein, partial [Pseudoprimorskyibacter sp.]|nr:transposase domain-containing protein [Pseudoprimorskyibacter sp.]
SKKAGRVELDNNSIQRPIVLNRKKALFAGHDAEAQNRAMFVSLIETCKLNAVDPHAWLTPTLQAIHTLNAVKNDVPNTTQKSLFPDRLERQTIHKVQQNVFLS